MLADKHGFTQEGGHFSTHTAHPDASFPCLIWLFVQMLFFFWGTKDPLLFFTYSWSQLQFFCQIQSSFDSPHILNGPPYHFMAWLTPMGGQNGTTSPSLCFNLVLLDVYISSSFSESLYYSI